MEVYLVLIAGLFGWAAAVFYYVTLDDGDVAVGAFVVLVVAVIVTFLVTGIAVPTEGDPILALLDWVTSVYGLFGLGALVAGGLVGNALAEQKRRAR